jgi:hypothetical protein
MRSAIRTSALCSFIAISIVASSALAITDPAQPQPNNGSVVVMGQPQQGPVQPPPPPRLGLWLQARAGGGIQFLGGTQGNAFGTLAAGYIRPEGFGVTLYGTGRYIFSPVCSSVGGGCTSASGAGLLDIELGVVGRYTALPQSRLHPVAEVGGQIHILPFESGLGFGYGGQLAAGIEFDLTESLSFDVLARAQLFYAYFARAGFLTDVGGFLGFRIEPVLGLTLYF